MTDDIAALIEIIAHFAKNDWRPGEDWAFPDDNSSLCLDHRLPDGTKFWLDIEKNGITIMWHRPDTEAQVTRFVDAYALRALAQENERMKKATSFAIAAHDTQVADKDTIAGWYANALERIAELEAEREQIKSDLRAAGILEG